MNKTKRIKVKEWSTHTNVYIYDLVNGGLPRLRNSSSQSHLNKILKEENAFASHVELITTNNTKDSSDWSKTIQFKPMQIEWRETEFSRNKCK
jgi:hypothetical protein